MGRVRRSGTAPELALRGALRRAGLRYASRGGRNLPGSPDITFRRERLAVFVDGCFWHGCPRHGTVPKSNTPFWVAKIRRNRQRDRQTDRSLKKLGWTVLHVWEHELRSDAGRVLRRIERRLTRLNEEDHDAVRARRPRGQGNPRLGGPTPQGRGGGPGHPKRSSHRSPRSARDGAERRRDRI